MKVQTSIVRLVALTGALAACGGDSGARPVVIPDVPAGVFEAGCQQLCALAPGETICKPKHAEFCLARCRASTRDLPSACGDCLITKGTPIAGYTNSTGDSYCPSSGVADLTACAAECDDAGAAGPSPDLDVLCQLQCAFYVQEPNPLACSAVASADCLAACRTAIAAHGRICAQCVTEQTIPEKGCINEDCDCSPMFRDSTTDGCDTLCDAMPPT